MAPTAKEVLKQQEKEQLERIASISLQLREAIRKALPTPPEQFMTVMVPGKVVNFKNFIPGYDPQNSKEEPAPPTVWPRAVQLEEAILCDDMPALAPVALGPTGRSVARSYGATLSKLCPAGTTVGVDEGEGPQGEAERRYKKAMDWLTSEDPKRPGKNRIDNYREKQTAYTLECERKTKAFNEALNLAKNDVRNVNDRQKREAYDAWVSENAKTYRNGVQAAYMDWVTNGKKEEAEYWFSVVDNDSAMSRVEASKEAMRAAIVTDSDGAVEYQTVSLSPKNWAWLASQKAGKRASGETVQSLAMKIARLKKINVLLKSLVSHAEVMLPSQTEGVAAAPVADSTTDALVLAYFQAKRNFEKTPGDETKQAQEKALTEMNKAFAATDKAEMKALAAHAEMARQELMAEGGAKIKQQIGANEEQIKQYEKELATLQRAVTAMNPAEVIQNSLAQDAGIEPALGTVVATTEHEPDYWTSISVEVSASHVAEQSSSSSTSSGGSASYGFLFWSVGSGGGSHSSSSANAAKQMASSSVKVSFDCMRVDIQRSWLRPELFYDADLRVPENVLVSPGPDILAAYMDPTNHTDVIGANGIGPGGRKKEDYEQFPMFPTAFLLAANVVLEISGDTSDVQSHFATQTTTAKASVGWGPFSVTATTSHTSTEANSSCEATASGCRITIKSPQIIGWISQIVPALPRIKA